jgi:hypothetical protein
MEHVILIDDIGAPTRSAEAFSYRVLPQPGETMSEAMLRRLTGELALTWGMALPDFRYRAVYNGVDWRGFRSLVPTGAAPTSPGGAR